MRHTKIYKRHTDGRVPNLKVILNDCQAAAGMHLSLWQLALQELEQGQLVQDFCLTGVTGL